VLAFAPAAQAGPLVSSATSCEDQVLEQPFLPWLDPASYVLAPDGTIESGAAGWSRSGASVVSGNEPYYVHAAGESRALRLPAGSSATTPSMCVGIEHPTLRLFARRSGSPLARLKVEVLFEDALGGVHALMIGNVPAGSGFEPTPVMPIVVNLLPLLPGERTAVAFRFTPQGAGDFEIDDVYVDPYRRH
jgi:hypothetical protein